MRRARAATLLVAALGLPLAGACGSSENDEEAIRAQVAEFTDALDDRDSERICGAMSPELFSQAPCDETILIFAEPPQGFSGDLVAVEVDGDRAVAELERGSIELERVDDEWKVAQLP